MCWPGAGSELSMAVEAAEKLEASGKKVRVVSFVCWELFEEQEQSYRDSVLPPSVENRVSVEVISCPCPCMPQTNTVNSTHPDAISDQSQILTSMRFMLSARHAPAYMLVAVMHRAFRGKSCGSCS